MCSCEVAGACAVEHRVRQSQARMEDYVNLKTFVVKCLRLCA
jgi:hypothetical protein